MKERLIHAITYLVIISVLITLGFVMSNSVNGSSQPYIDQPILLVHGIFSDGSNFKPMENYLKNTVGIRASVSAINLPSKVGVNNLNGPAISKAVDSLLAKSSTSKLNIIAHSMGGANSLYYINKMEGKKKVDKLITLGGANRLETSVAPEGVAVTTISSKNDVVVIPLLSNLTGANNIVISGPGHNDLVSNSNVQSLVKDALSK
jgi:triacylglycerol lipase